LNFSLKFELSLKNRAREKLSDFLVFTILIQNLIKDDFSRFYLKGGSWLKILATLDFFSKKIQ